MARPSPQRNPAIESLKEKVAKDPFSRAFLQLAEEYRKTGRFEDAVQVCLDGLARHPTYHTARIALGRTYLEAGNLDAARRALAEVLEMAPENHLAGRLLAEVQRKIGDTQGAAETYRTILRHYPADKEIEALLRDLTRPAPSPAAPTASQVQAPSPQPQRTAPVPAPPVAAVAPAAPRAPAAPIAAPRPTPRPAAAAMPPPAAAPAPPPAAITGTGVSEPSFDYSFEDLGLPAPPATRAAAKPAVAAAEEGLADELQTNTLAELYLRQGLVDKAIEVYGAMLRLDPENDRILRRLQELGGNAFTRESPPTAMASSAGRPPVPPALPMPVAAPAVSPVAAAPAGTLQSGVPAPVPGAASGPNAERLERLRRFLNSVQADRSGKAASR